jgi:AAA domain
MSDQLVLAAIDLLFSNHAPDEVWAELRLTEAELAQAVEVHRDMAGKGQNGGVARRRSTRLLSLSDLEQLPPPSFLLQDFLRAQGFNVLYGPSESGKSFLALDWSLCIASGLPFYGQVVDQGAVVYIAAEGAGGVNDRIQSWLHDRGVEASSIEPHLFVYPEAVNFFSGETSSLVAAIEDREIVPILIVVDTMARCMIGGDENSSKDVGLFIANLDGVARGYGSASLTVHHTGKNGELERGSSALRGAADTMVSLKGDPAGLKLRCEKQKEWQRFDPWDLHLVEVAESCVNRPGRQLGRLSDAEKRIVETVPPSFGTDWVSPSKVIDVSGVPKTSLYRALNGLVDAKYMESRPVGKQRTEYRLTEAGIELSQPSQTVPGDGPKTVPPTPHL